MPQKCRNTGLSRKGWYDKPTQSVLDCVEYWQYLRGYRYPLSHSISYICVICNCCVEANTILTVPLPTPLSTFHINSVFIHNTTRRVPQSICYNLLNKSIFDLIQISGM